jgi:redox-sensitive bicupin YhaK (pirin superfamily)
MNASYDTRCHFLQIWILPERAGLAPGYEQAPVPDGRLVTLAARDGTGAVRINQDARVLLVRPTAGTVLHHALGGGRGAWLHVVNGTLAIDGHELAAGDAAAVTGTETVAIRADRDSSLLVFDVRV